jgi:transposase-like protein
MKKFSKEEKAKWVEGWRRSGKTAWSYAKENGLVPQTFNNWAKPRGTTKQVFIEIPNKTLHGTRLIQELIIEQGNIKIRVPITTSVQDLEKIIIAVGKAQ